MDLLASALPAFFDLSVECEGLALNAIDEDVLSLGGKVALLDDIIELAHLKEAAGEQQV